MIFLLICIPLLLISCKKEKEVIHYNAFSHNDYSREHPLFDALHYKYNCVEADIHLINGQLYVAHDEPEDLSQVKTLEEMYLKPLQEIIQENEGKVYPGSDRPFFLMVDFKSDGEETYAVIRPILEKYKDMFCSVIDGTYKDGPILLFFSGNRPFESLPKENTRWAFLDGRISDLGNHIPATLMPVISNGYPEYFQWDGTGKMPDSELALLRSYIRQAHAEGKKIRFWGGPDTEIFKRLLIEEHVDLIGEDNLADLYYILEN